MKKIITALLLLATVATFSQQLTYKNGGAVYKENKRLSPDEVRQLLSSNNEALALYNSGRSKKTWGNVLLYGGLGLVVTNLIVSANTDHTTSSGYDVNDPYSQPSIHSDRENFTAAIIGSACIVAAIPIKIGFSNKIKSALDKYNKGSIDGGSPERKVTLLASPRQIGFKLEF